MKKAMVAKWMNQSRVVAALLALRRRAAFPLLTVLTYHRVAELEEGRSRTGIDATPAQFDRQLAFLREHFRFIGMDDLRAWARGGALPPNPVLVTVDDGYRECRDVALPILERHRARATFFVATAYLGERRMFWWDFIGEVTRRVAGEPIELSYPRRIRLPAEPARAAAALLAIVKTHAGLDLARFRDHLLEASRVAWSDAEERAFAERMVMRWDDVLALHRAGMDVQSHTRTHRVLHTLSPTDLRGELDGSRADLEAALGAPVDAVAYPVGYRLAHLDHVRAALAAAGYRWGFTNQTGVNHVLREVDRFDVNRISMSLDYGDALFRAMMALPYLAPLRRRPAALVHGALP